MTPRQGEYIEIRLTLSQPQAAGLRAVARWLTEGLHLLLNDGPTRRAVDKLYAAIPCSRCGGLVAGEASGAADLCLCDDPLARASRHAERTV